MAVRSNIVGIDSPEALEKALRAAYYLADDGIATAAYLGARARQAAAARRRARRRQDRSRQGDRRRARPPADPPAMLRGHRRLGRALRVELSAPDAGDPPGRRREHRHLWRGVPDRAADAGGAARAGLDRAADRRNRPRRPGIRGLPARIPLRLPDFDSRARHGARRRAAGRRADLEPHARPARGAAPPLRLSLDRLSDAESARRAS